MTSDVFETPDTPDDRAALAAILGYAFGFDPDDGGRWFELAGHENLRVWRRGGEVLGGLLVIPMGQFFGGRAVPMAGIAGVGVRADARRQGVATGMMTAVLGELRAAGFALSTLYASNVPLYRRVGYEQAGSRFTARLAPDRVGVVERSLEVRCITGADETLLAALNRRQARLRNGHLDRGPYIHRRQTRLRDGRPSDGFVVGGDEPEGYLCVRRRGEGGRHDLHVTDFVATTPRAARRLWTLLGDHWSMVDEIVFSTAPNDPHALLLPDRRFTTTLDENWMVRVLDVERALSERGYPPGLEVRVDLAIDDDALPENAGPWVLEVADGRATVRRGGAGTVRLTARGLAAVFTGFLSPSCATSSGLADGPEDALLRLGAAFAGPPPWMPEMF